MEEDDEEEEEGKKEQDEEKKEKQFSLHKVVEESTDTWQRDSWRTVAFS